MFQCVLQVPEDDIFNVNYHHITYICLDIKEKKCLKACLRIMTFLSFLQYQHHLIAFSAHLQESTFYVVFWTGINGLNSLVKSIY